MSIGKQQIIHIASEVVIITGISIYFQLKVKNLHSAIEKLENKIEQQDQVIQNHEQLLLRIMNNIDSMNSNIFEMRKSLEDKKSNNTNPSSATKVVNKKDKDKKENNDKKTQSKLSTTLPQQKPQKLFNPLQMQQQPIFFPNIIPQNENIFVMEIKPTEKMSSSSHKIEEIIEEKNNEDLDKELEKELEELEKEIIEEVSDDEDNDDEEDEE